MSETREIYDLKKLKREVDEWEKATEKRRMEIKQECADLIQKLENGQISYLDAYLQGRKLDAELFGLLDLMD